MAVWWQGADDQENVTGIVQPFGGGGGGSSGPQGGGPHGGFNVPDPKPDPSQPEQNILWNNQLVGIGYHPGQVDPGLAAEVVSDDQWAQNQMTGGFDVTYPGPSQPDAGITGITGDGTVTPTDEEDDKTLSDKVKEVGNKLLGVLTGPEIKQLTPRQLAAAKQLLSQYQALGITNPLKLRSIMANNICCLFTCKDQTFSD